MTRAQAEQEIRARTQAVYLGDHLALVRVLGQAKMFLSTTDAGFASHVMLDGFWEIWLTLFFARVIAPGMTVIDVGANFGYYTLLFGRAVGPSGRVIASRTRSESRWPCGSGRSPPPPFTTRQP